MTVPSGAKRDLEGRQQPSSPPAAARRFMALRQAPLTAWFGMTVIFLYVVVSIFAHWLAPYGEAELVGGQYEMWSDAFPLGTDQLGRDMLTRLIFGIRNTVAIALVTTVISFAIGMFFGLLVAIAGGWVDQLVSRVVDIFMAIPNLIFTLLLLTMFGTSALNLVLVIAVLNSTRIFRLTRAVANDVVAMDFIEAARLQGERIGWIMFREILPNIAAPLLAEFGLRFCFVFLTISALAFLGLGLQPPTADLGSIVRENSSLISYGDITPLLPAGAIALLSVAVNFVVDWMLHRASGLRREG